MEICVIFCKVLCSGIFQPALYDTRHQKAQALTTSRGRTRVCPIFPFGDRLVTNVLSLLFSERDRSDTSDVISFYQKETDSNFQNETEMVDQLGLL